ncbi:uncharacterized protein LOC119567705 [Chelonia mydas]|uniref:uncharacterized protein LOC119567705 n=1 Tax=Chelonia mydas TaxID=8469 RepID=UPI0018A211FD|nr:uncharacterized protein LOC119567705 [Chelonia mydas]
MDTSESSSTRQEEKEESGSEGAAEERRQPSIQRCVQPELFSSQEEGSQLQRPVLGEGQTPEEVHDATLRSQPFMSSPAERLQRIRKGPRRSKEDMLHEVTQQSLNENQKLQEWRESERRVLQQNVDRRHRSTERLLSIMERQVDSIQALVAMQVEHFCPPPHPHPLRSPCPKTLSLVPPCHVQPSQPPSLCILASQKCSTHCTALQMGRLSMITGKR